MRGRPRPDAARRVHDRLKLHRRHLTLDGRRHTVITLRPGSYARFSTNHYHQTWHVLTDWHGTRLLGRLLWGLAYQRVPGTLLLIDRPFLDPNPFEAEPADPIALVPAQLTRLTPRAARDLRRRLPLRAVGEGTVRWRTHGLDIAVAEREALSRRRTGDPWPIWIPPTGFQERVERVGGILTLTASPRMLRENAVAIHRLADHDHHGMSYTEVDGRNGEVQIFRDYRRRVSAARVARREVLSEHPGADGDALQPLVWERGTQVRHRGR